MKPREPFHAVGEDIRKAQAMFEESLQQDQAKWTEEADRDVERLKLILRDKHRTQERADKAHAIREKVYQERQAQLQREEQDLGRGSFS